MKKGEMLASMLIIATSAHNGQFDRGGAPYILHCLKVMHYTKSDDEEILCIAVGHDLFEDTKVTPADLREAGVSDRVISGILSMTKMPGETYDEYKAKVKSNKDSTLVKMADLRHNSDIRRLKGVTDKDIARVAKYMKFFTELRETLK
jgi:guanosine-3',5'-bis(diphosphate) 3'-pyrophosphohydrolase